MSSSGGSSRGAEPLRALVGVTAAGKTELALAVAERGGATVLSLDSMLVYRGLDVGTAKPTRAERERVPHRLLDLVEPSERYDVQRYLADFAAAERELDARGERWFAVGGTGLYLQALVHGVFEGPTVDRAVRAGLEERLARAGSPALHAELAAVDPDAARRIHPNDAKRVRRGLEVWEQTGRTLSEWQASSDWGASAGRPRRIVGLECAEPELTGRIERRTCSLLERGWVDEARAIRAGPGFGETASRALGYREVLALADGRVDRAETEALVALRTRQFARRQRTWFRRFPEIEWVERGATDAAERVLAAFGWAGVSGS